MSCPHCGAVIADSAPRFCAACGRPIQGAGPSPGPSPGPPPGAAGPGAPNPAEETLFDGHPAALPSLGALLLAIVTVGLGWIVMWMRARSTHYRITTQRVVVETGLFSKRMDQMDVYRIVDYVVERPFSQRLLGTGNLVLEAMDQTTPQIRIQGIRTDVVKLYEQLRTATESEKARRGVRVVDGDHPYV
jgi:hypothetical protein